MRKEERKVRKHLSIRRSIGIPSSSTVEQNTHIRQEPIEGHSSYNSNQLDDDRKNHSLHSERVRF